MSSVESSSVVFKNVETRGHNTNFVSRHHLNATSTIQNVIGKENPIHSEDQETMELLTLVGAKEKEIQYLREQIALATIRGSQQLNEKFSLERKYSELRMVLDEKQSEVIASASNELARRKGDLEVNFNLLNELKDVEDEKHIFTSSMIGILAECGALPYATNASALTNSVKHLHDQLQLKIKTSHAKVSEMDSIIGNKSRLGFSEKKFPSSSPLNDQFSGSFMNVQEYPPYNHNSDGKNFASTNGASTHSDKTQQLENTESLLRKFPDMGRNVADQNVNNTLTRNGFMLESEQTNADQFSHPPRDGVGFSSKEDGPEIDDFQIAGVAKPGCKLVGCGHPAHGTLLCMFQWVRLYPDGTIQFIEGATNPDYIVTADDVDKIIAVECIPMDEKGRQGNLVRAFANDHSKITCDEEMQEAIDTYVSSGLARFEVLILLDTSENWEPASLSLMQLGFLIKVHGYQDADISDRYSEDLMIKIPSGLTGFPPQFVLTCSNGSSYPFSTSGDTRLRDTLVLTMRIFQSKALDEKRKGRA